MRAELLLKAGVFNNQTHLLQCYCTTPFKVANITEDKTAHLLRLMLMSSSPGILDGDNYQLKIELGQHSSVHLQTQSYQRLFTMKGCATQQMEIRLQAHAKFCFIPQPVVPHAAANFSVINKIYLSANCRLIFGEVITCGRKLNGEVFLFTKYHSVTEVFIHNKLVVKENLLLQPAVTNLATIGQMQGFSHQASLIYLEEKAEIKLLLPLVINLLEQKKEINFGVTRLPANGLLVRILGQKAEQLFECLNAIATCLP